MKKQRIKIIINIISWILVAFCFVLLLQARSDTIEIRNECKALYQKEELTAKDLKTSSTFASGRITESNGEDGKEVELTYRRLYGIEYVGDFHIEEDGGIEAICSQCRAKILILDEQKNQRFYREVSGLYFEPGQTGKYDVYFVGNKYTGRVVFSTY